jgi:GT2 family glycosyltransferase
MRVMLGVPTTRDFPLDYVRSLWGTATDFPTFWYCVRGLPIDIARNKIVEYALENDFDFLLMHDSDASWHPDALKRLVHLNLPVVSAVVYQRRFPTVPFAGTLDRVDENGDAYYSFKHASERVIEVALQNKYEPSDETWVPPIFEEDVVEEVDACGSHFVLIRKDVLQAIEPPHYKVTHPPSAGEDFWFCRKVKEAGFPIYVNYAVHTGHIAGDNVTIGLREFFIYSYRGGDET